MANRAQSVSRSRPIWWVPLSFLTAFVLLVMSLPESMTFYRPDWVTLVLVYWCMRLPRIFGVGIGFGIGLLMDFVQVALLGQHAMTNSVVAFLAVQTQTWVRNSPLWLEMMLVCVLLLINSTLIVWVQGVTHAQTLKWEFWLPAFIGALVWPVVAGILDSFVRSVSHS